MNTRIKERTIKWKQTIIFSMFVLLAAQINFDIFTTYFRVSLGIIMIPILIFLFQRIPLLPVTVLSGIEMCIRDRYKGVEIDEVEKASEITDDDVDAYIQSMQESKAEVTEITDRAVEDGDTVSINFVGKMNGEEFEGGSAEDYSLTIGSGVFIEGFEAVSYTHLDVYKRQE